MSMRISVIVANIGGRTIPSEELSSLLFSNQTVRDFDCIEACIDDFRAPGAALNQALAAATGEYVMFACTDDCFTPDAIEQLLRCADENYLDLILPYQISACTASMELGGRYDESPQRRPEVCRPGTPLHAQRGPCAFSQLSSTVDSITDLTGFVLRKGLIEKCKLRFGEDLYYPYRQFSEKAILFSERVDSMDCNVSLRSASKVLSISGEKWIPSEFLTSNRLEDYVVNELVSLDDFELRCFSSYLYQTRCRLARLCSEGKPFYDEAIRYRDSLSRDQRMLFDEVVLELGHHLSRIGDEVEGSITFRVGRLFTSLFDRREAKK